MRGEEKKRKPLINLKSNIDELIPKVNNLLDSLHPAGSVSGTERTVT